MSNSGSSRRRPAPLSVRLTEAERGALQARAGGLPLSTYLKAVLFAENAPAYRRAHRIVLADRELVGRALAALGASRVASNLSQIAKAIHQGNLICDEETRTDLRQACADVAAMRALLMQALGKESPQGSGRERLSSTFGATSAAPEAGR